MRTLKLEWIGVPGERINETPDILNCGVYVIDYDTRSRNVIPIIMGLTTYESANGSGNMSTEP